jgi:hypothetical protein
MTRRFETDYAGAWRGHYNTRESAIGAAMRHVAEDGYSRCTITDKLTGMVVARVQVLGPSRHTATVEVLQAFKLGTPPQRSHAVRGQK